MNSEIELNLEDLGKKVEALDMLLQMGNVEQQLIIGLRYDELQAHTAKREQYLRENAEIFKNVESIASWINENTDSKKNPEHISLCRRFIELAILIKLQNMENMSLLREQKLFFNAIFSPGKELRSYNCKGKVSPAQKKCLSLIDKKI